MNNQESDIFYVLKTNDLNMLKNFLLTEDEDKITEEYNEEDSRNALHFSNPAQTKILLESNKFSPYDIDDKGIPAAFSAVKLTNKNNNNSTISESSLILFFMNDEMCYLTKEESVEKLKICMEYGFDINFKYSDEKNNAYFLAECPEKVYFLKENGCDIDYLNANQMNGLINTTTIDVAMALINCGMKILDIEHDNSQMNTLFKNIKKAEAEKMILNESFSNISSNVIKKQRL